MPITPEKKSIFIVRGQHEDELELVEIPAMVLSRRVKVHSSAKSDFRTYFDLTECFFSPEEAIAAEARAVEAFEKEARERRAKLEKLREKLKVQG